MQNIKGILVSIVAPMENHIANGGEKLLGNASSIKKRNDGRVYVSGQMQRHVLFSAINRLNLDNTNKGNTYVSNGDGIGNAIEVDLRADMGGFMHPSAGSYSGRRTAPLSVTPAVAMEMSSITRDLLIRLKVDGADDARNQALATKEQSDSDLMVMNFFLDITNLSISKKFTYNGGFHVQTEFVKHVTEKERKRRVRLFLEATRSMVDYANEARNAVTGEPQKVLIVFDTKMSRKACRYFEAKSLEQKNIITEITSRSALYFTGDDTQGEISVEKAYADALNELDNSSLFDPCGGDSNIQIFANAFPQAIQNNNAENTADPSEQ
jgi:CRISPR-associated protein Cst2